MSLNGKVALVAGATRGAGRGIAVALGEAGATVYCTGRSSRSRSVDQAFRFPTLLSRPRIRGALHSYRPVLSELGCTETRNADTVHRVSW